MIRSRRTHLLELHSATFLFGLTGLFGKFLHVAPMAIVFGRSLSAAAALGVYLSLAGKFSLRLPARGLTLLILSSLTLGFHWVSFFHCVQISTVAIGVLTYSTSPVFSTILEPWFFDEPWKPLTLFPAVLVMLGVLCLAPTTNPGNHIVVGACWGTASGLAFAVFTLMNRLQVRTHSPQLLTFGQNALVSVSMLLLMPRHETRFAIHDAALMATLGILCTAVAQSLYISSLRGVSAQLACIVTTLEAPYGILFAAALLGEIPPVRTIIGGAIILAAATLATWMQQRNRESNRTTAAP